jgi:hypothetical protein
MTCEHCGQELKQARRETLNKHELSILQTAAHHVAETNVNDFQLDDLSGSVNHYNNWQKLRYHGLVHHVRDSRGQTKRGHWLITRNGWAFLRGELDLPKWVTVKENAIVQRSGRLINVRDVYRGSEAITTVFEYFDDNNQPVGARPVLRPERQMVLALE